MCLLLGFLLKEVGSTPKKRTPNHTLTMCKNQEEYMYVVSKLTAAKEKAVLDGGALPVPFETKTCMRLPVGPQDFREAHVDVGSQRESRSFPTAGCSVSAIQPTP